MSTKMLTNAPGRQIVANSQAYSPFLIAVAPAAVAAKDVHGPGLTSGVPIPAVALAPYWDEAWTGK